MKFEWDGRYWNYDTPLSFYVQMGPQLLVVPTQSEAPSGSQVCQLL